MLDSVTSMNERTVFLSFEQLKVRPVIEASLRWGADAVQQDIVDAVTVEVSDIDIHHYSKVSHLREKARRAVGKARFRVTPYYEAGFVLLFLTGEQQIQAAIMVHVRKF